MTVLQTIALPLGYSAIRMARGASDYGDPRALSTLGFRFEFRLKAELAEPANPHWR